MDKSKLELVMALLEKMEDPKYRKLFDLLGIDVPDSGPKDWTKVPRTCTKCGLKGYVEPDFGTRKKRNREFAQGWCRRCRATTNYGKKPRVRPA